MVQVTIVWVHHRRCRGAKSRCRGGAAGAECRGGAQLVQMQMQMQRCCAEVLQRCCRGAAEVLQREVADADADADAEVQRCTGVVEMQIWRS